MSDEVIERVAAAMCAAHGDPWEALDEDDSAVYLSLEFAFTREEWRILARAAIEEHKRALAEAGYVIVLREPAKALTQAWEDATTDTALRGGNVWRFLLAIQLAETARCE